MKVNMKNKMKEWIARNKKKFSTALGVCVAIVLAAAIFIAAWNETSYIETVDTVVSVCFKGKTQKLNDLAPEEYWDHVKEEKGLTMNMVEGLVEDLYENHYEQLCLEYGEDFLVEYEVVTEKTLAANKMKKIQKVLKEEYGIDKNDVTEGKKLEVVMFFTGSEDWNTENTDFTMVKIRDNWYMVDYSYDNGKDKVTFAQLLN